MSGPGLARPMAPAKATRPQLAEAARLHQAGQWAAAEAMYRRLLQQQPGLADAHNLLGLVLYQRQDLAGALASLRRAVALRPRADYHRNLGMALRAAGQPEAAVEAYGQALALDPTSPETLFNLGNVLSALGRGEAAMDAFRQAVALRPDYGAAWQNLGTILLASHDPAGAREAFGQARRWRPADAAPCLGLGRAALMAGEAEAAAEAFAAAMALGAEGIDAPLGLGQARQRLADWPAAEAAFRAALACDEGSAEAWLGLGIALVEQQRPAEAVPAFERAARLRPGWADAPYNLACAHRAMGASAAAEAALRQALALAPGHKDTLMNLANLCHERGAPQEALALLERAEALAPDDLPVQVNLSREYLTLGLYRQGWARFASRWRAGEPRFDAGLPAWRGGPPLPGRLLLWREQGIGDEVMYAGLLPELLAAGHALTLYCDPRLEPVYARSFPGIRFHHPGESLEGLGAQCPIGDLPGIMRNSEKDFAGARPYLRADPARQAALRARYADGRPLIGLSWHSISATSGPARSLTLAQLAPLLARPGLRFISLQYGVAARLAAEAEGLPLLVDQSIDGIADMDGLMAQIAAMDLVISIDNSTVHFAGALGVPCWTLLPFCADWRWQSGRQDSPWYPGMRLFRQPGPGEWAPVLAALAERLGEEFAGPPAG